MILTLLLEVDTRHYSAEDTKRAIIRALITQRVLSMREVPSQQTLDALAPAREIRNVQLGRNWV